MDRRAWTKEEDQAIQELVAKYGIKKWTIISEKMEKMFDILPRSGKQCRERWYNHLDPTINKKEWTQEEELIIFQAHKKFGNKWADISKYLVGRTDNSVKNHFYSTLRKSLRRINKFLGDKNSTVQVKEIKPGVLSKIFQLIEQNYQENDENFKKLIQHSDNLKDCLFNFAHLKPNKNKSQQQNENLKNIIGKINEFNSNENAYDSAQFEIEIFDQKPQKHVKKEQKYDIEKFNYKLNMMKNENIENIYDFTNNNEIIKKQEIDDILMQQQTPNQNNMNQSILYSFGLQDTLLEDLSQFKQFNFSPIYSVSYKNNNIVPMTPKIEFIENWTKLNTDLQQKGDSQNWTQKQPGSDTVQDFKQQKNDKFNQMVNELKNNIDKKFDKRHDEQLQFLKSPQSSFSFFQKKD